MRNVECRMSNFECRRFADVERAASASLYLFHVCISTPFNLSTIPPFYLSTFSPLHLSTFSPFDLVFPSPGLRSFRRYNPGWYSAAFQALVANFSKRSESSSIKSSADRFDGVSRQSPKGAEYISAGWSSLCGTLR